DSDVLISDVGHNSIRLTSQKVNHLSMYTETAVPSLVSGKTYTISAKVKIEEGTTGNIDQITVAYCKTNGGTRLLTATGDGTVVGKEIIIKGTSTVNYEITDLSMFYLDIWVGSDINGSVIVSDIKIEEGSTATPYQPNLLLEPYNMCREYPNENIANKSVAFPIKSSAYEIYKGNMEEDLVIGQTYTITLKGTKPANSTFAVHNDDTIYFGSLNPVEGLTDVWSLTFTPTEIASNEPKKIRIVQYRSSVEGASKIDWLKIEKGDTRTPNISQFKYFGEGLKDSNNPNNYSWDVTPEYAEKALTNTLNLTDPQTALGLKNFKDGAQIDGVDVATVENLGSVLQSGSGLTTIQSDKQSAFDEFSYEFERIGDRVFFHARVKTNSTTAVASHVNLLEIPLGFQFPIGWTIVGIPLSVVQWTTPQGEISALAITDLTGKQVVKFATNRVGNHYISGEWRTADSYPETK
ncbi:TPA: BppU family phage baseplate upper protein, partial [Enterococcus faecium 1,230,933]